MDFQVDYKAEREREVDLIEYWRMIIRRKWVIIALTGALILFAGVFSFLATPVYKAKTTLLIEEESSKMLSIEDEFGYQRRLVDMRFFNTQLKLLGSMSLAERVARKMNLLSRSEFGIGKKSKKSLISAAKDFITLKWISFRRTSKNEEAEAILTANPYSSISAAVQGNIEVKPIRDTNLVEVSYSSPYPILSAEIINTLAEEFITFSIEKRYETTQQASDFLSEQIANLREDLAAKERELQRYGKEKKLFFLSDEESAVVSKFTDLTEAFTIAQIDRIKSEALYRELRELEVDSLPQFVSNPMIQNLKTEYTRMKNEYEEKSKVFKPNYPAMTTLKAGLDSMREELKIEIRKAIDQANRDYNAAIKKETSLGNLLDEHRTEVVKMNSNAILYNSLKIEVENLQKLLNSLVERQKEALVSARLGGLKTSSISIIDKAEVPRSPISPNKRKNLFLAFLIGIFGGVILCFFMDYLDNTIKGPEEVERLTGLPSLGLIPYLPPEGIKEKRRYQYYSKYKDTYSYGKDNPSSEEAFPAIKEIELINYLHPKFFISEDYRTVRTSILLSYAENPPKSITFTSALPSEGKTASVVNMAVAFSQLEQRVLLMDADLRKARLHRIFKVKNIPGLSGYLTGKASIEEAIQKTSLENVWILPSGPHPPNPTELLNSLRMKELITEVKEGFSVVLVDTPPIMAVIDPVIVSSFSDSTVIVVQAAKTTRKPFLRAVEELERAKAKIMGVLFNEVKVKDKGYFSPYSYYYRSHYHEHEEEIH